MFLVFHNLLHKKIRALTLFRCLFKRKFFNICIFLNISSTSQIWDYITFRTTPRINFLFVNLQEKWGLPFNTKLMKQQSKMADLGSMALIFPNTDQFRISRVGSDGGSTSGEDQTNVYFQFFRCLLLQRPGIGFNFQTPSPFLDFTLLSPRDPFSRNYFHPGLNFLVFA